MCYSSRLLSLVLIVRAPLYIQDLIVLPVRAPGGLRGSGWLLLSSSPLTPSYIMDEYRKDGRVLEHYTTSLVIPPNRGR